MKNTFSLESKKIVLTGASGFFGPYFTEALLNAGAEVIALSKDFSGDFMSKFSKEIKSKKLWLYEIDFYNEDKVLSLFNEILERHGVFNSLINNAFDFSLKTGFNDPSGKIENVTYEQLKASFDSGVYWAIRATKFFGIEMKRNGGGSIVNIASMYGVVVPSPDLYKDTDKFNPPGYSMAKAGLIQFTKYSAAFMGPDVRVNALSPGAIPNVELSTYNAINLNDPVIDRLKDKTLLKRMGHPTDLTGGLIFLVSDASSYVTGHNLIIDGGLTVT